MPAFKGYRGYPATLCASVNDEVVHGIPSKRKLNEGDILSLDMGVLLDGFYGDSAVTVGVGRISDDAAELLRVTREALHKAIDQVRVGGRLSDIGNAIQRWVEAHGFSVVREFVGHGIGASLHEEPQVPNYGEPGRGPAARRRDGARNRADGERGPSRREDTVGRLDGGHARRQLVGALRAYGRCDLGWPARPHGVERERRAARAVRRRRGQKRGRRGRPGRRGAAPERRRGSRDASPRAVSRRARAAHSSSRTRRAARDGISFGSSSGDGSRGAVAGRSEAGTDREGV